MEGKRSAENEGVFLIQGSQALPISSPSLPCALLSCLSGETDALATLRLLAPHRYIHTFKYTVHNIITHPLAQVKT